MRYGTRPSAPSASGREARGGSAGTNRMKTMDVHVALLRGVNVGGANKLAMSDLKSIFESAGCARVETIIQSGNVVFEASAAIASNLSPVIEAQIRLRFGIASPVILRSADALRDIVANNPFLFSGVDPTSLHVLCLSSLPNSDDVAALDPRRSPPDEFILRDREIFLRLPNGVARSKLTNAYFDRTLRTTATLRNWRTMTRLCEAAQR